MTHLFHDDEFGDIIVTRRATTRRFIARWKQTQLHVSSPINLTDRHIAGCLNELRAKLRELRLKEMDNPYRHGYVFNCYKCKITLIEHHSSVNQIQFKRLDQENYTIATHPDFDLNSVVGRKEVKSGVLMILKERAGEVIIPLAQKVAQELDLHPRNFIIGHGITRLGLCKSTGEITISCINMFYPEEVIRYVIIHELAHLTHLDHSPAFHALVDSYTGGREAELKKKLCQASAALPIDR